MNDACCCASSVLGVRQLMENDTDFSSESGFVQVMRFFEMDPAEWVEVLDVFCATPDPYPIGRVDLLRAPAPVLAAIPGIDEATADAIVAVRGSLDDESRRTLVWPVIEGVMTEAQFQEAVDYLASRSMQWRVRIEAGISTTEDAREVSPRDPEGGAAEGIIGGSYRGASAARDEERALEDQRERERLAALAEEEAARRAAAEEQRQARESRTSGGVPVYVVQSGEVLGVIAQRELGTVKRMDEIIDLNPGLNPDKIRAGLSLRMPPDWQGAGSAPTAPAAEVAASGGRSEVPDGMRVYVVKDGESLWKIAANQLGSGGRYRELEKLNPGIEGGRIVEGQEILIPAVDVTLAQSRPSQPARREQASTPSGRRVR